jgi:16S rRNA (uracil1498-N3)-methyltransferase
MHRFFVPPETLQTDTVILHGALVHQLRDVLRVRVGETIALLDNSGFEFRTQLLALDPRSARGRVLEKIRVETEPRTCLTLFASLLKGQKFEWVLQKATEMGVSAFVPVISARCVVGVVGRVGDEKWGRWGRILIEAAEQAGRAKIPRLEPVLLFENAVERVRAHENELSLIPFEGEHATSLSDLLEGDKPINLFIGPEGGYSNEEIELARAYGLMPITLGPRILRAETAALAAVAAILFARGDWGV